MFQGTFFVGDHEPLDNDFIGIIFSFQDSSNFYLLMSARDDRGLVNCQGPCHQGNWQLKLVSSDTGPQVGKNSCFFDHLSSFSKFLNIKFPKVFKNCWIVTYFYSCMYFLLILKNDSYKNHYYSIRMCLIKTHSIVLLRHCTLRGNEKAILSSRRDLTSLEGWYFCR